MRALLCDFTQQIRRSVGRIVIDENGFPAQTSESNFEAIEQGVNVIAFVEGRYDHRQLNAADCVGGSTLLKRFGIHCVECSIHKTTSEKPGTQADLYRLMPATTARLNRVIVVRHYASTEP